MLENHIVSHAEQRAIAQWMIEQFNHMLIGLAAHTDRFVYIKTPGTLNVSD